MSNYILELRDRVLIDIYKDWQGKNRLTLAKTESLVEIWNITLTIISTCFMTNKY